MGSRCRAGAPPARRRPRRKASYQSRASGASLGADRPQPARDGARLDRARSARRAGCAGAPRPSPPASRATSSSQHPRRGQRAVGRPRRPRRARAAAGPAPGRPRPASGAGTAGAARTAPSASPTPTTCPPSRTVSHQSSAGGAMPSAASRTVRSAMVATTVVRTGSAARCSRAPARNAAASVVRSSSMQRTLGSAGHPPRPDSCRWPRSEERQRRASRPDRSVRRLLLDRRGQMPSIRPMISFWISVVPP